MPKELTPEWEVSNLMNKYIAMKAAFPDKTNKVMFKYYLITFFGFSGPLPCLTVVSACLINQFGLILWQKTSDGAHFFLVQATEKI